MFGKDDTVIEGRIREKKEHIEFKIDPSIKVSIIMPAYNASKYLVDSVESVKKQSFKNWELIIIDDCSIDNTAELIKSMSEKDSRIIFMQNTENCGVAQTRNAGIKVATGKYIAFLDSDDIWFPNKLERQLEFMEKNRYAFSFSSYLKFDSNTGKNGKIVRAPKVVVAEELLGNTIIGCLTVIYNREKIGKVYMPNIKHMEDNATWYSVLAQGYKAYGLDEVLAKYRENNNSLTANKWHSAILQWDIYRDYFKFSRAKSAKYFVQYVFNALKKYF